jgi:16S rRNA (uracil1498-N3)-methyltransferase
MTRRRWIADEVSGNRAALVGSHAEHLVRVLRARVGQEFDVGIGASVRRGRVVNIGDERVEFELGVDVPMSSPIRVTVILSIFKFDRMDLAIEKCTELGATRIIPMIARRTQTHLAGSAPKRTERWCKVARQAAEQARRIAPPEISQPMNLKEAMLLPGAARIVLAEADEEMPLKKALRPYSPDGEVVLAFGPEGGWTEYELDLFRKTGWILASLGNTILRAETAAIAALAVVMSELSGNDPD